MKSLKLSKKLTPKERFEAFLELQEAMVQTYFQGLKARNPNLSSDELLEVAKEENLSGVK